MTAHDDRARDEQPAPPRFRVIAEWVRDDARLAGQFAAHLMDARGAETASVEPLVEQPAPTAREIPADELAEAEAICREWLPVGRDGEAIYRVMAEYDERGRERDAARAEVDRLRVALTESAGEHGELVALRAEVAEAKADLARSETKLKRVAAYCEEVSAELERGRTLAAAKSALITELRTRDEAAKAVVQTWGRIDHELPSFEDLSDLAVALDALARAHEEKDGGQDR